MNVVWRSRVGRRTSVRLRVLCVVIAACVVAPAAANASRGYELVTPGDTSGVSLYPGTTLLANGFASALPPFSSILRVPIVSESGDQAFVRGLFFNTVPGTQSDKNSSSYIASRGNDGWSLKSTKPDGLPQASGFVVSSLAADFSIVNQATSLPLAAGDPGNRERSDFPADYDLYQQSSAQVGTYQSTWLSASFQDHPSFYRAYEVLNTRDGRHSLFKAQTPLTSDPNDGVLYMNDSGAPEPEIVSVLPGGQSVAVSGESVRGLSGDGQRVLFLADDGNGAIHVYVRLRSETRTVDLGPAADTGNAAVPEISADGSTVLLPTLERRSPSDVDDSVDLYAVNPATGQSTLLSGSTLGGAAADDCGATYGIGRCDAAPVALSSDGARAYFVSPEALVGGAAGPTQGAANLYVSDAGHTRFLATLADADVSTESSAAFSDGSIRDGNPSYRPVRLSSDGSILAIESRARLTSYDNAGNREIYRIVSGTAQVECASCPPESFAPTGSAQWRLTEDPTIPMALNEAGAGISADGRSIYFSTDARIAQGDVNDKSDVYQFDAGAQSATLLSDGTDPGGSYYIGSSADGRNVLFLTRATLTADDKNGRVRKIYDSREGGGLPRPPQPSGCVGSDCRGPSSAGQLAVGALPSSESAAQGNVEPTPRQRIVVRSLSRAVLRKAASSGVVVLIVRTALGGKVAVSAAATVGSRSRTVGRGSVRTKRGKSASVRIRLSSAARSQLRRRNALRLKIKVTATGARERSLSATVRSGK